MPAQPSPRCPHCHGSLLPAVEPTSTGFDALPSNQVRDCLSCSRRSQWTARDGWQLLTTPLPEPESHPLFRQYRLEEIADQLCSATGSAS